MARFYWYATFLLTALACLGSALVYTRLPEQVPIHWNIHGQADGFGPKQWAAFLMPAVMLGMLLFFRVMPWLSPRKFEVDSFRLVYLQVMLLVTALLGYIHLLSLWAALNNPLDMNQALLGGLFLFFAAIGIPLRSVRRNFWIGVRTPWTLADERVWDDTHRLASRIFVIVGLLGLIGILAGLPAMGAVVLLIAAALVPVVYSLVRYKQLQRLQSH